MENAKEYLTVKILTKPNSKKNEFCGFDKDKGAFVFKIKAPAIDNKANKMLLEFVQRTMNTKCELVSGMKSRIKIIVVEKKPSTLLWFSK